MTVQTFLDDTVQQLKLADISTARLDCLILLEDALGIDRASILAHPEADLTETQLTRLNQQIIQRLKHIPLACIRGRVAFFGRDFLVDKHVLVPRPETEIMIELLKKLAVPAGSDLLDVGTGSGCIGITSALEIPDARVTLSDIDPQALKVAGRNAERLAVKVTIRQADLLADKPNTNVILANLPYVPDDYRINRAAEHEPKHAIFGGKDGLNLYRKLWQQIATLPRKPLFVLTEALPLQHEEMTKLASQSGYKQQAAQGFIQVFQRN